LQVLWSLLVDEVSLYDIGHVLRGHHVAVVEAVTMATVEFAHIDLSDNKPQPGHFLEV
jgi:hypothetical protein